MVYDRYERSILHKTHPNENTTAINLLPEQLPRGYVLKYDSVRHWDEAPVIVEVAIIDLESRFSQIQDIRLNKTFKYRPTAVFTANLMGERLVMGLWNSIVVPILPWKVGTGAE